MQSYRQYVYDLIDLSFRMNQKTLNIFNLVGPIPTMYIFTMRRDITCHHRGTKEEEIEEF